MSLGVGFIIIVLGWVHWTNGHRQIITLRNMSQRWMMNFALGSGLIDTYAECWDNDNNHEWTYDTKYVGLVAS